YHYSFTQLYSGVPVYQSEIKVNTDKRNTIVSLFDNSYPVENWQIKTETADEQSVIALHPMTGEAVLAQLNLDNPNLEALVVDGEVIYVHDRRVYAAGVDSVVTGMIFNPDPLTT